MIFQNKSSSWIKSNHTDMIDWRLNSDTSKESRQGGAKGDCETQLYKLLINKI